VTAAIAAVKVARLDVGSVRTRDIADYLSAQELARVAYQLDPVVIAAGKAWTEELGCATCHLPTFRGAGEIPRLVGQVSG
jgi:hypothetical protein